jgi:hypothetical protein
MPSFRFDSARLSVFTCRTTLDRPHTCRSILVSRPKLTRTALQFRAPCHFLRLFSHGDCFTISFDYCDVVSHGVCCSVSHVISYAVSHAVHRLCATASLLQRLARGLLHHRNEHYGQDAGTGLRYAICIRIGRATGLTTRTRKIRFSRFAHDLPGRGQVWLRGRNRQKRF